MQSNYVECFLLFRYSGTGINLGECGIEIMKASTSDSGQWSCHMGTTGKAAVEASKEISVRVSGERFKWLLRLK